MRHSVPVDLRNYEKLMGPPQEVPSLDEEPICVMKLELNDGYNVQTLKVFAHDVPEDIVENFAIKHNLSEKAKNQLLENVYEQLNEESNVSATRMGR